MLHRIQINRGLWGLLLLAMIATVSQAAVTYNSPTSVLYSAGPSYDYLPDYTADKAIDGDLNTFCVLWDDTLDDSQGWEAKPAWGIAPTTGYMIFDMGSVLDLTGVRLNGRADGADVTPKDVEFFYFADNTPYDPGNSANIDIENDANLVSISNVTFSNLNYGAMESFSWSSVSTQYIGMKVNSSYEEGPTHFNYQIGEIGFLTGEADPVIPLPLTADAIVPTAVPYSSGPSYNNLPEYAAEMAIDRDMDTFCVLWDDTLDGTDSNTIPANAAASTTGHMVFDLGEVKSICGADLFGPTGGANNPKSVDFFYYADDDPSNNTLADDIEGDADIVLIKSCEFAPTTYNDVAWEIPVDARYIGVRINSSYEEGPTHYNYQMSEMRFYEVAAPEESWTSPQAITDSSGPSYDNLPDYAADMLIDGDRNTFCVLWDDTLDGTDPETVPANADAPTTGHIVFDLGQAETVYGAKLLSRLVSVMGAYGPENVDFFYFADDDPTNNAVIDDIEGDADIVSLGNFDLAAIVLGESETVAWEGITAQYIGMRINSGYEEGLEDGENGTSHYNFQLAEVLFSLSELETPVEPIPGDANGDGKVDGSDVTILAGNWQVGVDGSVEATWEMGDFNGDKKVDGSDVTILAGNWQHGVDAGAASVPEPSTMVLLLGVFASLAILRRTK